MLKKFKLVFLIGIPFSISFFNWKIVFWSSDDSLSAVCTLDALATISAFNSAHFFIKRFSFSCDLSSARCNFSYSIRNFSSCSSCDNSCSTSWNSLSSASKADEDKVTSSPSRPSGLSLILLLFCTCNCNRLFWRGSTNGCFISIWASCLVPWVAALACAFQALNWNCCYFSSRWWYFPCPVQRV